jgi:uncharacterized LabA/DUF88 family protein
MITSRARLYIDGYNFYYAIERTFGPKGMYLGWCNFERLARRFLLPENCELLEIKYFTAPVGARGHLPRKTHELPEREKQRLWLRAVATIPKLKRIDGYYAPDEKKDRVEKQTDVNIAVEMVRDAALRKDFDQALLITSDLDLRPAAVAVANWEDPQINVTVWFPPESHSMHWHKDNPERLHCKELTRELLEGSRLREDFTAPDGPIHCLDEWRCR